MSRNNYQSMKSMMDMHRRDFLKISAAAGAGLVLGTPDLHAQEEPKGKPKTNIDDALKIPRTETSMPGKFPGKVVEVFDEKSVFEGSAQQEPVDAMFAKGIQTLTGKDMKESFNLLFTKDDVVGIKVNPVGAGLINTNHETVHSTINWLVDNGLPKENIIIWDRFESMLSEAGFNEVNFPGVQFAGLQIIDESAWDENAEQDESRWRGADGKHLSFKDFDQKVYYWADVKAPQDDNYLNQHVTNDEFSYFGKLLTQKLTKIINIPVFKNTGNGISMATKNLGYGAICNTGRLHRPLFFDVCVEVLAFPVLRDKVVLNITDGLKGQYDGGPGANASFIYDNHRLYFATDAFAIDRTCHDLLVQKRKEMDVKVNEHPRYSDYFNYAEELGLGIGNPDKIEFLKV